MPTLHKHIMQCKTIWARQLANAIGFAWIASSKRARCSSVHQILCQQSLPCIESIFGNKLEIHVRSEATQNVNDEVAKRCIFDCLILNAGNKRKRQSCRTVYLLVFTQCVIHTDVALAIQVSLLFSHFASCRQPKHDKNLLVGTHFSRAPFVSMLQINRSTSASPHISTHLFASIFESFTKCRTRDVCSFVNCVRHIIRIHLFRIYSRCSFVETVLMALEKWRLN